MILFPNAKINLGLRVLEKRPDGFHSIETVFLPINLTDVLEFVETGNELPSISISGTEVDGNPNENLVMKAWQMMHEKYHIPFVDIHLHKNIPMGAGLGGGSADAAFMLKGLNEYFSCACREEELINMAGRIGSDCAFFIRNTPMLGSGRGEILEPLGIDLHNYEILLIKPDLHISTRDAYSEVTPTNYGFSLKDLVRSPITDWQRTLVNDFEASVFTKFPEIKTIKDILLKKGALYATMSGSGSSVYGIFNKDSVKELDQDFGKYFVFRSRILE